MSLRAFWLWDPSNFFSPFSDYYYLKAIFEFLGSVFSSYYETSLILLNFLVASADCPLFWRFYSLFSWFDWSGACPLAAWASSSDIFLSSSSYFSSYLSSSLKPCSESKSYSAFLNSILEIILPRNITPAFRQSENLRMQLQIADSTYRRPDLCTSLSMNF